MACAVCLALILGGCGFSGWFGPKERTLVFRHWDEDNAAVYEQLAETYEQRNPGLSIELQVVPREEYVRRFLSDAKDKTLADAFLLPADSAFSQILGTGQLADLTGSAPVSEENISGAPFFGTVNSHVWALPFTADMPVVFYHKSFFQKLGLMEPLNLKEMATCVQLLCEDGVSPIVFASGKAGESDALEFAEGILTNSCYDTPLLMTADALNETASLDTGFGDLIAFVRQMYEGGYFSRTPEESLIEDFAKGKYAMLPARFSRYEEIRKAAPGGDIGFFVMAGGLDTKTAVLKSTSLLGVWKGGKLTQDARGFLSYLTSAEGQGSFCSAAGVLPGAAQAELTDPDLSRAQRLMQTGDGFLPSFFQRMDGKQLEICSQYILGMLSQQVDDENLYLKQWYAALEHTRQKEG